MRFSRVTAAVLAVACSDAAVGIATVEDVTAEVVVGPVCTSGERRCDLEGTVIECSGDGTSFNVLEHCEGGVCTDGACGCIPDCFGRVCGDDGCGGSCGGCTGDDLCRKGLCTDRCLPEGTGTGVGDAMATVVYAGEAGPWSLALRCGAGATLFIEAAIWCNACGPALDVALAAASGRPDIEIVLLLGESSPGSPPTETDVAKYRADFAVPAEIRVLRDPLFEKTAVAVNHAGGGLPFFILLDRELVIRYAGLGGFQPQFLEVSPAIQSLEETE